MQEHNHSEFLMGSWQLAPEILIPLVVLGFLYLKFADSDIRQTIYFFCGLVSIVAVVNTPIGTGALDTFSFHMIQHITLMMVIGPLLVLGTPETFNPQGAIFRFLTHPIFSWLAYAALMIGVHLPIPHQFIMDNPWAHHYLEIYLYIVLPYLFYFNLLDRKLSYRRVSPAIAVISLFLMMVPETLTGFFIYTSRDSLYDNMYTLNDQRIGGSLMWSGAMIIDTIWMSFAVYHWIKSEEKKSQEIDLEIAQERLLDNER